MTCQAHNRDRGYSIGSATILKLNGVLVHVIRIEVTGTVIISKNAPRPFQVRVFLRVERINCAGRPHGQDLVHGPRAPVSAQFIETYETP